jgi:hypothetical protein
MPPSDIEQISVVQQIQGVKEAFHVAYYHAERAGFQEKVSKSLRDFMNGSEPQTSRWISLAVPLIKRGSSFDVIIRALLHGETSPVEFTPLDRLCQGLAEVTDSPYSPERLEKTRVTADFSTLGGRLARRKELDGVFRFDATGLPQSARVLIVDSVMTTGATIESIALAVKQALPQAEVLCFVLGKADGKSANKHLNPDYFLGLSSQAGTLPLVASLPSGKKGGVSGRRASSDSGDRAPVGRSDLPDGKEQEEDAMATRAKGAVNPPVRQKRKRSADPKAEQKGSARSVRPYLIGLVVILLVLGALGSLRSGRMSVLRPEVLPDALPVATELEPGAGETDEESTQPPVAAKPVVDNYPKGRVAVPGVGLRTNHSLESKAVPRSKLKNGETVSILGRYAPSAGPRWLQIKTRSGKVGWVFASVVKVSRRR